MSEPYTPAEGELMANSVQAELSYLKDELESLLAKPPATTAGVLDAVRQALYSAEQVGVDTFQYR